MKRLIWIPALLLAGCIKPVNVPEGDYKNEAESDYSVASTTLQIQKASPSSKDLFTITKLTHFKRKTGKNSYGKLEHKVEHLTARFDSENSALLMEGLPNPFILSGNGDTLTTAGIKYIRKK